MRTGALDFDVAVVGAGPAGAGTALAHARRGARVVLFEANPKSSHRLAGEWLHPPAIEILRELDIDLPTLVPDHALGAGFVVYPDDGSDPHVLPYADGTRGLSCKHRVLVDTLRETAASHPQVHYIPWARVRAIDGHQLHFVCRESSGPASASAQRIVGAEGRSSIVRGMLGLPNGHVICSRMVSVLLHDVELPFEGYGHVFLGGPGPVLAYRMAHSTVRLIFDVPLQCRGRHGLGAYLWEGYAPVLPENLRPLFRTALMAEQFEGAVNQVRMRSDYGRDHLFLVGDAVGHYHPLTAVGITLGLGDGLCLAQSTSVREYQERRLRETRVPEMLAVGLYEAFSYKAEEAVLSRRAIYSLWGSSLTERKHTMRYLSCQDARINPFARAFVRVIGHAFLDLGRQETRTGEWAHALRIAHKLGSRLRWIIARMFQRGLAPNEGYVLQDEPSIESGRLASLMKGPVLSAAANPHPSVGAAVSGSDVGTALARAVAKLVHRQSEQGGWEGEVVWCPMLAAQYVLMCHITGTVIPAARRKSLLLHFHRTRLPSGLWGLHPHSAPYLFVSTLVYVAARLLGAAKDDPLLVPAAEFIKTEGGVAAIPSWGKFWLALLNLYEWDGVNPVLPELWALPRSLPLHPGNFYCHTRLIHLAMAVIYAARYQVQRLPIIDALREELYPAGYAKTDFRASRNALRPGDLFARPARILRLLYALTILADRWHNQALRTVLVRRLRERIRWELRTTNHSSISPVSGLLNIIALWLADPEDGDLQRALQRFEGWIWEDIEDGMRITGARSTSWDTAFALQALVGAAPHVEVDEAIARGVAFLEGQQIRESFAGFAENFRIDPKGGWCFAGVRHGWPVSDCTAEALTALLAAPSTRLDRHALSEAVQFIFRCQNPDGGFGSYEKSGTQWSLEWLNPAEMFADSMTDRSWIECTASCIEALAAFRKRCPEVLTEPVGHAIARAARWLGRSQRADGSWPGAWGVYLIYGTLFGVRGLLAAGTVVYHPAIRRACRWLLAQQRADGGWGEHHAGSLTGRYTEHPESQVIQTAWALLTLLHAQDTEWTAIERGVHFLIERQDAHGEWPQQDMAGVFFRTALLDYTLYRSYFPLWALGLYQSRRKERATFASEEAGGSARLRNEHVLSVG